MEKLKCTDMWDEFLEKLKYDTLTVADFFPEPVFKKQVQGDVKGRTDPFSAGEKERQSVCLEDTTEKNTRSFGIFQHIP